MPEFWNIYDRERRDTGKLHSRGKPLPPDEYHIVVNAWLRNRNGDYLISRRSPQKTDALHWESTGGSILAGETSLQGAIREVKEELGIDIDPACGRLICSGIRQYESCPDILDVWLFDCDAPIESVMLQQEETCDAKYASAQEIAEMYRAGEWIPLDKFNYLPMLGIDI